MSEFEPLTGTLLDLAREVAPLSIPLTVGGGFGLYLKQEDLRRTQERTLFSALPPPRSTSDIDLFLRAEILVQLETMQKFAQALEALGFVPVEQSKYFQWRRVNSQTPDVILDLLVGPLGEFNSQLRTIKPPRVRPHGDINLHAHLTEEAIEVDTRSQPLVLSGFCTDGAAFETEIYIPQAFTYLMMKLFAFDDRKDDASKDEGRHHAMDLYRIVAMLTEEEYRETRILSRTFENAPATIRARQIVANHFQSPTALGVLRLREHQLFLAEMPLDEFIRELNDLLRAG